MIFENKKTNFLTQNKVTELSVFIAAILITSTFSGIGTAYAVPILTIPGIGSFGIDVDSSGNIYATNTTDFTIEVFDPSGNPILSFGSECILATGMGCIDPDGAGPLELGDGQFSSPFGIAVDNTRIYTTEFNERVQVFDLNGNFLFKFGSECFLQSGDGCIDPDGAGPLELGDGQFNGIAAIDVDSSGNIYVSGSNNQRIQVFDSAGNFLFKFGTAGSGNGQFGGPFGVSVDSTRIYVADTGNNRIQVFDLNGNFLFTFGSTGSADGQFMDAFGVDVDSSGNIYVADASNARIQIFDSNGNFLDKIDTPGASCESDVAVDASGKIYHANFVAGQLEVYEPVILPQPATLKITETAIGGDDTFGFTVTGPTPSTPSIMTVSGTGIDGPNIVQAGTYSIQQSTIPTDWSLPTAMCNDGSSTFSVDTISRIVINPGDNIECEFINTFEGSTTPADQVQDLIDLITGLGLPNGVENSLLGPLHMAIALLEDGNPNNDTAVCGKLTAFINQVDAKEANGDLTAAQAQQLRDAALAIQSSLGC